MPPPLDVNREAVRTLVVAVGVRQAARQMGLPQPTVQAWSARFKWLGPSRKPSQPLPPSMQPTVATGATKTPSTALQDHLNDDSRVTRSALSAATRKAAVHLQKAPATEVLSRHKALASVAAVAGKVHEWDQSGSAPSFTLNLAIVAGGMQTSSE